MGIVPPHPRGDADRGWHDSPAPRLVCSRSSVAEGVAPMRTPCGGSKHARRQVRRKRMLSIRCFWNGTDALPGLGCCNVAPGTHATRPPTSNITVECAAEPASPTSKPLSFFPHHGTNQLRRHRHVGWFLSSPLPPHQSPPGPPRRQAGRRAWHGPPFHMARTARPPPFFVSFFLSPDHSSATVVS